MHFKIMANLVRQQVHLLKKKGDQYCSHCSLIQVLFIKCEMFPTNR